jgi:hypothetical protein
MPKEGPATLAWTNRCAKESKVAAFQTYWENIAPKRYKDLKIRAAGKPPELRDVQSTARLALSLPPGHSQEVQIDDWWVIDLSVLCI